VRLFSQVGPVVLFVAALYYRFARHDALRFYVFFGAAAIVACFYLFATKDSYRPMKDLNFVICKTQAQMLNRPVRALRSNLAAGS
jgi:hypothetical protein